MSKLPTFYKLPAQKSVFLQDVKRSPRLASIWAYRESTTINATKTLPISILSKQEIYNKVVEENPDKQGVGLKFKQVVAYGKTIINFYKSGIKNVWQNQSTLRKFKKDYYINHINSAGEEVKITIPSFTKLVEVLSQRVYMEKVELEAYNKTTKGEIKKDTDTTPILNLTREQFQIYKRTPPDFYKIPLFALICLVFEELTPVLCYLVPEITPSTCILPNILPRVWNPKGILKLKELNKDLTVEQMIDLSAKTSYNLDLEHVRLLCQSLRLVSRTTPIQLYPETYLRGKLQEYYNYLIVDNYYLSGLNKDGNLWNLTDQELIVACLERNLIQDIVFDTKEFNKISDPIQKKMFQDKYMNKLRVKLFQFLVDFPHFNIGYLSVHHVIPRQEEVDVISWR